MVVVEIWRKYIRGLIKNVTMLKMNGDNYQELINSYFSYLLRTPGNTLTYIFLEHGWYFGT